MTDVVVRSARASDLDRVAALHREVFSETMGVSLGLSYTHDFLRWFLETPTGAFLVLEQGNELLGYAFGAAISAEKARNRALLPSTVRGLLLRPWMIAERRVLAELRTRVRVLLSGERVVATAVPESTYSLVGIGIAPKAQGQGIATRLLRPFVENVRGRGAKALRLSVYESNARARRLYEREGFTSYRHPTKADVLFYLKSLES